MSLFERIKNIRRSNLQEEKIKFPGGTGDIGFTAPKRQEKVQKRLSRADKLGTPDPFDPDYDKKVKKVDRRTKTGKVFKSTKPVTTSAPGFGKGSTPGEIRVKGLETKAFKKTKPSDIKLPKSFTDFESNLQDYKDRDLPGGPRKTTTKPKTSGTPLTRQDVGMAPPDKPKTKVVKQSEVSKKAQEFTKTINQKRQTTTPSKSDVERIKQNKIDTKKADAFKKTAAYKNIAQGKDSKGNYLSKEQRKANFIKQTKQNKATKNKTVKHNKNFGTSKTVTGKNKVTTGMGAGAQQKVTYNKDFIKDIKNPPKVNRPANYGTASYYKSQGKDAFDLRKNPLPQGKPGTRTGEPVLPKFSKKSGVTNPSFMKKVMPKMRKAATPAAKAFSKAGPVGKLAAGVLAGGALIYGANQVRKAFTGAGKPKAPPVVKGSALRYTSGPKKGQKKYFDIKTMKKNYFTKSDFRDSKGNIDSGFNDKADKKLQIKLNTQSKLIKDANKR